MQWLKRYHVQSLVQFIVRWTKIISVKLHTFCWCFEANRYGFEILEARFNGKYWYGVRSTTDEIWYVWLKIDVSTWYSNKETEMRRYFHAIDVQFSCENWHSEILSLSFSQVGRKSTPKTITPMHWTGIKGKNAEKNSQK